MSKLESSAELQKIGQLLGVKSQELEFLQDLPLSELVKLRALNYLMMAVKFFKNWLQPPK